MSETKLLGTLEKKVGVEASGGRRWHHHPLITGTPPVVEQTPTATSSSKDRAFSKGSGAKTPPRSNLGLGFHPGTRWRGEGQYLDGAPSREGGAHGRRRRHDQLHR